MPSVVTIASATHPHLIQRSISFPILTPDDLQRFLRLWPGVDETTLACQFLDWVKATKGDAGNK